MARRNSEGRPGPSREVGTYPGSTVTIALNDGKPQTGLKPVKGWRVHQVDGDVAVVSTGHVYYSVRAGHVLPGPGVVRAIRKRGDQWVVLTAKGVISANTEQ